MVNLASEKIAKVDHKSEDILGSVSSNDLGAIFLIRLDHDLSKNVFVVSIVFPERISLSRIVFFMTPKNRDFHEFSSFLEICLEYGY